MDRFEGRRRLHPSSIGVDLVHPQPGAGDVASSALVESPTMTEWGVDEQVLGNELQREAFLNALKRIQDRTEVGLFHVVTSDLTEFMKADADVYFTGAEENVLIHPIVRRGINDIIDIVLARRGLPREGDTLVGSFPTIQEVGRVLGDVREKFKEVLKSRRSLVPEEEIDERSS